MKNRHLLRVFKEYDWGLYITRQIDLLTLIANARSNSDKLSEMLGFNVLVSLHLGEHGLIEYYRNQEIQQEFILNMKEFALAEPDKTLAILEEAKAANQKMYEHIQNAKSFKNSLEGKSTKELQGLFEQAYRLFHGHFAPCVVIPYFLGIADEQCGLRGKNDIIDAVLKKCLELRAVSYYIDYRDKIIKAIFQAIAKKAGLKADILDVLTPEEISQVCDKTFVPDDCLLEKRQSFVYVRKQNQETLVFGKDAVRAARLSVKTKRDGLQTKIIRGHTGFGGRAEGRAKIINHMDDFPKFEKGNVLVTINSNPTLLPVIHQCRAIVSDEGGITCHAAVLSRELRIPCVIGTRNATKLIKDGDLVEVDADQGIVNIIRKAKDKPRPPGQ